MDFFAHPSPELQGTERDSQAANTRREGLLIEKGAYLLPFGQITVLASPRSEAQFFEFNDRTRIFGRSSVNIDRFDVTLQGMYEGAIPGRSSEQGRVGLELAGAIGDSLVAYGAVVAGK